MELKQEYNENPDSDGLVIFIHGFMGSPVQFEKLADAVYRHGYSSLNLLLPGHGSSMNDFASSTCKEWQQYVDDQIDLYGKQYRQIYLVGHSMGGLLAVNASIRYENRITGVMMIASPFKNTTTSCYTLKIRLKQVFSKKNNPIKTAYLKHSGIPIHPSVIWSTAKPSREVRHLIKETRSLLPEIKVPVTAVFSEADELVPLSNLEILKTELKQAPLTQLIITESLHAYYTPQEEKRIEESLIKTLEKQ